jgi:paxillin
MGKTWHPEHFTCQHCNKQMSDDPEGYHEHHDKAYCRPCYIELFAPYCRGCNKPIVDKICVTALDAKWHQDCFVCRVGLIYSSNIQLNPFITNTSVRPKAFVKSEFSL